MPTINKRIIAKQVPLSDRTFIVGDDELMGYLGVNSTATLKKSYLDCGLKPTSQIGRTKYYDKKQVDKFIINHNEWQEVKVK